jgi:parallel beta-helix repeat protein
VNCIITGNTARDFGGGIYFWEVSEFLILNCTITNNTGDGINALIDASMPIGYGYVKNTILWGNTPDQTQHVFFAIGIDFDYCCVQDGFYGTGNIDKYPEFVDTTQQDWSIKSISPCINMGANVAELPQNDIAGNPRIYDGKYDVVDIGAYEYQGEPTNHILEVSPKESMHNITGVNRKDTLNFSLRNDGADSLKIDSISFTGDDYSIIDSAALNMYLNYKETVTLKVLFSSADTGTHTNIMHIYYNNKHHTVSLRFYVFKTFYKNQSVSGRWAKANSNYAILGEITVPKDSTLVIEPGVVVKSEGGKLIVKGRLVAEGAANDTIVFSRIEKSWVGMSLLGESPSLDSSILSYCKVEYSNGIHIQDLSTLRISNSNISQNISNSLYPSIVSFYSILCENSSPLISTNHITGNRGGSSPDYSGASHASCAGIKCSNSSNALIVNNVISDNTFSASGYFPEGGSCDAAGIWSVNSSPLIVGNLIKNNSCSGYGPKGYVTGGGVIISGGKPFLVNNTIVNNQAKSNYNDQKGSGIYTRTELTIVNCIIWNNPLKQIFYYNYPSGDTIVDSVMHCSIRDGYPGVGNQSAYPLFNDTANDDWTLKSNSPCINSGMPDFTAVPLPPFDLYGNPRFTGHRIDIGAFESDITPIINNNPSVNNKDNDFIIVPNIAELNNNIFKFYYYTKFRVDATLKIYDPLGNELFSKNEQIDQDNKRKEFAEWDKTNKNRIPVAPGAYLAVLITVGQNGNRKTYKRIIGIKR